MLAFSQIVAIGVGAFYAFAGAVVMRALALDRIMNQLLAALNDPEAAKERRRSHVMTVGAFLTSGGGVALMLLSPFAPPLFVVGALWQCGYLLWAERALPPEDDDDARGRRLTKNAFVVYLAAAAFVVWLAARGLLRPWSAPWLSLVADAAIVLAAAIACWLLIHLPSRSSRPAPASEFGVEPETETQRMWMVLRSDDTGNVFLVRDQLDETEATELAETLTGGEHKQTYTVHSYDDDEERLAVMVQFNVRV